MVWMPCLTQSFDNSRLVQITIGHPVVDDYLAFVGARLRLNSWLAVAYDLKVFFSAVGGKEPAVVTTADVFGFIKAQRAPRRGGNVVRLDDGESGLSARTIKRRLASVSGLYAYLIARGDAAVRANPVPRGSATRRPGRPGRWGAPLIRTPRTLPRVLSPAEVSAFVAALRTQRDRAMAEAMLLGGLRRCEVLGLRMEDVSPGERRLFIAEGKGGHQRRVPISQRFFTTLAAYLSQERRDSDTDRVFVVLKQPRRGHPLSAYGLDQIVEDARQRAGIDRLSCHQLRHTCFTRLRENGMALEAIQAQAGHRSIDSTRIYVQLANSWLTEEYRRAVDAIEADLRDGDDSTPGVSAGQR